MTVIPTWVKTQLQDAAGLFSASPGFRRLGINFIVHRELNNGGRSCERSGQATSSTSPSVRLPSSLLPFD
jgi:hypothetical protein